MVRGKRPAPCLALERLLRSQLNTVHWLRSLNIIKQAIRCRCGRNMVIHKDISDKTNGQVWRCPACKSSRSIRTGSIMENFRKIPVENIVRFLWLWANNYPEKLSGIKSATTRRNLRKQIHKVVMKSVLSEPFAFQQGIYSVDESVFIKRKYHVGRMVSERWVFGMVNLDHPTKPIFLYVPDRTQDTLLGIIRHHIPAGSTIVSDGWAAYRAITRHGYLHLTVNHRYNFVDPATGAHTNNIERCWGDAKKYISPKQPDTPERLQELLNVYLWRKWRCETWPGGAFSRLLTDIIRHY